MKDAFLCIKNVGLLTSLNWHFLQRLKKIFEITFSFWISECFSECDCHSFTRLPAFSLHFSFLNLGFS